MTDKLEQMLDERDIINLVNSIGIHADRRDWPLLSQNFADEVLLDYSSMGAPVEKLKPGEIITRWKALLPGFKMTQHMITNHRVQIAGDEAECLSYVAATHHLPNPSGKDIWFVMGSYEHHLVRTSRGWKVDKMKFNATLIEGNPDLPELATKVAMKNLEQPLL
jgi:hypothetical protein